MKAAALSLLAMAGLLAAAPARAQYDELFQRAPAEPGEPGEPAEETPPPEPKVEEATPSHTQARFSVVGAYRGVYDLGLGGGGIDFSFGGDYPVSGAFELRILYGRSIGGLGFGDVAAMGSMMARLGGGVRLGFALGLEAMMIARATNGDLMSGGGLTGLFRLGYDFGRTQGFFVEGDGSLLYTGTVIWGPTLGVGYRF
ncbi:MAG TPA: hypothetical protein VGG39_19725 [Polyangiaceae bacterium]